MPARRRNRLLDRRGAFVRGLSSANRERDVLAEAQAVFPRAMVARDFDNFAKGEKLTDIDALIDAAVPFFTSKVEEFFRKACEKLPLDPVINMYMLLAGYSAKTPKNPARLFIILDRFKLPKIESNRVA